MNDSLMRGRCFFELGQAKAIIEFLIADPSCVLSSDRGIAQRWLDTWFDRIHEEAEVVDNE